MKGLRAERLDHLGLEAGICQAIGLATYVERLAWPTQHQVSVGTATVAMIWERVRLQHNRRLYRVSQCVATESVTHLLGAGITAVMPHDHCLGRTLDRLRDQNLTAACAGIAGQARQARLDTTSFVVTGEYEPDAHTSAVTSGSWRDHRADLNQGMLAPATTRQGDISLCCQALDGNASDTLSLMAAQEALAEHVRTRAAEAPICVAESGVYSAATVARLTTAGVRGINRVPATATHTHATLLVAVQVQTTGQTMPNQLKQPTDRPTLRWMFQCFEGMSVVGLQLSQGPLQQEIADLEPLYEHVITLLGAHCDTLYKVDVWGSGNWAAPA